MFQSVKQVVNKNILLLLLHGRCFLVKFIVLFFSCLSEGGGGIIIISYYYYY